MLTEKDMWCLEHVCKFGYITINQAREMFYPNLKSGYEYTRRRLGKLVENKYLKSTWNQDTNEKIFYSDSCKKVTLHSILLTNFYSKLKASGVEITSFEIEKSWQDGKYESDGFCIFELGEYTFYIIIEVNTSNNNIREQLKRYEALYDTEEVQNVCKGYFPTIIVIDNRNHRIPLDLPRIKVIQLDHKFNEFSKIFV